MQQRTQKPFKRLIAVTNNNFAYIRGLPPPGVIYLSQCLPAMKLIANSMGLKLNRIDNFNIVRARMERMMQEN